MLDLTLILDVETSGLLRDALPIDDPNQPHLVSLALKLVTPDKVCRGRFSTMIKPSGWSIEPEALAVHGITEMMASNCGIPEYIALSVLKAFAINASRIVGHHLIGFDWNVITASLIREGSDALWWKKLASRREDTMEMATPVLKLPGKIPGEFKWPTLEEAVNHFGCGDNLNWYTWKSSHRADEDVDATEYLFFRLMERRGGLSSDGHDGQNRGPADSREAGGIPG